jgi:hypothetical protein
MLKLEINNAQTLVQIMRQLPIMAANRSADIWQVLKSIEAIAEDCVYPKPEELPFKLMTEIEHYQTLMALAEMPQVNDYAIKLRQFSLSILIGML